MRQSSSMILACAVFLAACTTSAPAADETERSRVAEASRRFWEVRNSRDPAAFAAQFVSDGIYMVPGLDDATGQTAIRELAQKRFGVTEIVDHQIHRREIDVLGDSAHELGWFSETYRAGGESTRMHGRYVVVWTRGADHVWRVARYLYSFSGTD